MNPTDELSVREITDYDIQFIAKYWTTSDPVFLQSMGVDLKKVPSRNDIFKMLEEQIAAGYEEKKSYAIVWLINGVPSGHCNINKIIFGQEAYMHLHIWNSAERRQGVGTTLVKKSLAYFFTNFKLKKILCEPYALNPAPNKLLKKTGFSFKRKYITTPGYINFEQEVMLWEMTYEEFCKNISIQPS